jgi:xylulokinase
MDYVIGVDIGTQSTKALLVGQDGRIVATASQAYQVDTPRPMWAEQWPDVWFKAVADCIRRLTATAGVPAHSIKALCVSSLYGGSGIPVDADMQPLHPCLIWMDRRATREVDWVRNNVDMERLLAITGNGVDSYYGFTKMLWIKNEQREIWKRIRYFLPPNSYVNFHLTGELAVDHSSAGNIGGVYDMEKRCWSGEAMQMLGIPPDMMPPRLVGSSEIVAGITEEWADRLGLAPGTPVMGGGVDAAMATLAAGVTQPGDHVAMIGTSMCWGYINDRTDAHHGLISMPYVFEGDRKLYVFGGAIAAGASVSWYRDQFCQSEVVRAAELGGDPHRLLEEQAGAIAPGSDGVLFLPYLMGERSPIWDAKASGAFVGLNLYHTRAHLYRAVLEGVAFALYHNVITGARGAEKLDQRLIVVGGAAHSDLWMQIIADVTGYAVFTIREEVEAALGAALLAAAGSGVIDGRTVERGWIRLDERTRPQPAAHAIYAQRFKLYCDLYPALKDVMHGLQA